METLLAHLRELVQTETVVGKPIEAGGVVLIPISRISIGFGAGGGDKSGKNSQGGGGGARVEPLGFILISEGKAQILPLKPEEPALAKIVDILPEMWDTIRSFLSKEKKEGEDEEE